MNKKKEEDVNLETCSVGQLCDLVRDFVVPFEDVAESLENKLYAACTTDDFAHAVATLVDMTDFFERMPEKNEENCRDLADMYILIGEVYQYVGKFAESIGWFKKAAIVFDQYSVPYHNLATSFAALGDIDNAIKSLEQEIGLEPGNYYSILRLVDLYEAQGYFEKAEDSLKKILERNPDNIKALHKLIEYYENEHPEVDVSLMRRRLLAVSRDFNEMEYVIRTYHLCKEKKFSEALTMLSHRLFAVPGDSMAHLLTAHVLGELHQFSKKRKAVTEFRRSCFGKIKFMENKLEEFEHVFGKKAVVSLEKVLVIATVQ